MFAAGPAVNGAPGHDLYLVRAARSAFDGTAEFLADPANRDRVSEYLADMTRPYGRAVEPVTDGQSYGEMAAAVISPAVLPSEPVDLLVLAYAVHDVRPGRQTAAYLSHLTPGEPMAFAICDQGSAAPFTALRVAGSYASTAGIRRALVVVVEQASLPYPSPAPLPSEHRAVAMLYQAPAGDSHAARARVAGLRQHPGVPPGEVANRAAADLAEMSAGHCKVTLVLSSALAELWTAPGAAAHVRAMPSGQPCTEAWWGLADELDANLDADLVVIGDYDPALRHLSLSAFANDREGPGPP